MQESDFKKLLGCDKADMTKYSVQLGSLKTDPSNAKEVLRTKIK